ncbi:polysaccharide biosynthesis tyrosine autokinase [Actinospongicola halichondriae]|uniref:polysaccharide biosynthesis tyrosine autokinase n=1 Tax=Actinospongicola halichondriae TaxID=3236844 RepID=UPI003D398BE6
MDFFEAIQLLRRRWPVIVLAVIAGLVAGYVTAPGESEQVLRYQATTTLLVNPQSPRGVNLDQAALLTTTGPVPEAVAESLGFESAAAARRGVKATANKDTASIAVQATRGSRDGAEELSSAFADALIESLSSADQERYDTQLDELNSQTDDLRGQIEGLRQFLVEDPENEDLQSQLAAAQQQLTSVQATIVQFQSTGPPEPTFLIVERGGASAVESDGLAAPDGKPQRAILLGAFGLILGLGAAFALDRLDTKIRNKATAEAAFGYPVIAEIPPLPGGKKHRDELLALTHPSSPFVEAYRGLRTVVALTASSAVSGNGNGAQHGTVLLVTSPGAGEGKTTTAAHLAAMLAEVGRSVLVVSGDLRRPRLHVLFDVDREPGLTEMLGDVDGPTPDLRELVRTTKISRVRILPSGAPTPNPAPLLRQASEVLHAARRVFDFVIVDTAPILVANDATELATAVDGVILMARATHTSIDAAQRSAEILDRLNTKVLGTVLVGATDTPTAYGYYRNRYYAENDTSRRDRRKQEKSERKRAADPDFADSAT